MRTPTIEEGQNTEGTLPSANVQCVKVDTPTLDQSGNVQCVKVDTPTLDQRTWKCVKTTDSDVKNRIEKLCDV